MTFPDEHTRDLQTGSQDLLSSIAEKGDSL